MSHYGYLRLFVNGVSAALIKDHNNLIKPDQKSFNLSLLKRVEVLLLDMDVCIYLRRTAGVHCPRWDHMWRLSSGTLSIPPVGSARRTNPMWWPQTIGPLLADLLGLQVLPVALSIVWMSIVLPTTCESCTLFYWPNPDIWCLQDMASLNCLKLEAKIKL